MNILIVPSWYKTENNPILGSFFFEQAKALQKLGHKVIIADATLQGRVDYKAKSCYRLKKKYDEGVLVYAYNCPAFGRFRLSNKGADAYYRNLIKIFKRLKNDNIRIDIIHTHSYLPAGIAAIKLGKKEKIPVVITEHSSDIIAGQLNKKQKRYLKTVLQGSNMFISVSNGLQNKISELTKVDSNKMVVIPNIVSDIFELNTPIDAKNFRFVSIGNLIYRKRFDLVIRAFANSFFGKKDISLEIIGEGPIREELENLVKKLGVADQIIFSGRLSRKEVSTHLNNSNCFVLASDFETFGVVYIEALAVGVPVIGTRNGGAEDIITLDNGILVNKDNIDELSDAMLNIYRKQNFYNREQLAIAAKETYGELAVARQLENVYIRSLGDAEND